MHRYPSIPLSIYVFLIARKSTVVHNKAKRDNKLGTFK